MGQPVLPLEPFQRWGLDFVGRFTLAATWTGNRYILVAMDYYTKFQSTLWAYWTGFKTSIQSPLRLSFGLEAVNPIEFQVLSMRLQIHDHLSEKESERVRLQQLLELGESRIVSVTNLERGQRRQKAFVDRHRGGHEKTFEIGKPVLMFQTRVGKMPDFGG